MNIISFSGGKDSTALILWAKENKMKFRTIFCDTGWEDEITYEYVEYINKTLLNGKLIVLKSDKYEGFEDLSIKKKRVASTMARFCTEELKLKPTKKYIESLKDVNLYFGIRAEESAKRALMPEKIFDKDYYNCWIHRPLLKWTAKDVFDIHKKYLIKPNPLYRMGMLRVGCMPCIMTNLKELKSIIKQRPDTIKKVSELEKKLGRTFFAQDRIPQWAMTSRDKKTGVKIGYIEDFVKYVQENPNQLTAFEEPKCLSYYGLCE